MARRRAQMEFAVLELRQRLWLWTLRHQAAVSSSPLPQELCPLETRYRYSLLQGFDSADIQIYRLNTSPIVICWVRFRYVQRGFEHVESILTFAALHWLHAALHLMELSLVRGFVLEDMRHLRAIFYSACSLTTQRYEYNKGLAKFGGYLSVFLYCDTTASTVSRSWRASSCMHCCLPEEATSSRPKHPLVSIVQKPC